ncbi:MAG: hypothetical protein NTX64_06440, partial [Elusimicrobia bacterium]|nr:hypothetical protein [Elusimicrobiota bacterium]
MWVLASLASGCLLASAWPPHSGTHAVWVALAPLLLFVNGCRSPWRAFRAAWLAGFVYFLIIAYPALSLIWWGWAQTAAEYRASWLQQHIFLWIWYPVSSCFGGLGWGTWAAALVWLGRGRSPWRNLWLAPALWMIYEYAAGWIFFDFTWGAVGYMLHPYFRLRQFASVAGIYGLGGLVVLVNAWVAHALRVGGGVAHRDRGPAGPLPLRREAALLAGVLLVLALAFETPALTRRPGASVPGAGASLSVAALQAEMRELTVDELKSGALDWGYEPLLRSALDGGAELVVLPESVWLAELALDAVPTPRTLSPAVSPVQVMSYLGPKLAPRRAVLINGFDVTEQGRMYNSMVAWDATGMLGRYDKRRLTPFAEYPPGPFNLLAPANRITYSAGRGNHLFSVHGIPVGGFICLEVHCFGARRTCRLARPRGAVQPDDPLHAVGGLARRAGGGDPAGYFGAEGLGVVSGEICALSLASRALTVHVPGSGPRSSGGNSFPVILR